MIAGIFIGLGIAAVIWLTWFLAPLGDPETGAGRQEFKEGRTWTQVKRPGSNGPAPHAPPPHPRNPPLAPIHQWQPYQLTKQQLEAMGELIGKRAGEALRRPG